MYCKKCGKSINDSVKFCRFCGSAIEARNTSTPHNHQTTKKSNLPIIILIVIGFVVIFSIIFSIILSGDSNKGLNGKSYGKYASDGELEWLIELGNEPPGMIIMDQPPDFAGIIEPTKGGFWMGIYHFRGTFSYDRKNKTGKLIYGSGWGDKSNTSMDFVISKNLLILNDEEYGGTYIERK